LGLIWILVDVGARYGRGQPIVQKQGTQSYWPLSLRDRSDIPIMPKFMFDIAAASNLRAYSMKGLTRCREPPMTQNASTGMNAAGRSQLLHQA